jgi:hypothetical protein
LNVFIVYLNAFECIYGYLNIFIVYLNPNGIRKYLSVHECI